MKKQTKKTIYIAGAGGYIGSMMVEFFLKKGHNVIALDRFYFGNTLQDLETNRNLKIIRDDIRSFNPKLLNGVDVVINLASISNDPASELNPAATMSINYEGAVRLAKLASRAKVKNYIFSSSCSVYGVGKDIVDENSQTQPVSEYARSKIAAEKALLNLASSRFCVTIFRIATAYGLSPRRMRFDLIVNLMTLHAWKNKKIFILGGGRQWRPLIHIKDAISSFDLIMIKNKKLINRQIFNVGSNDQNFQVYQVANIIKKHFPEVTIDVTPDDPDNRSYRVNFNKFSNSFNFKPKKTIEDGIREINSALEKGEITDEIKTNTSWYYRYLIEADNLLSSLKLKGKLF